MISYRELPVKQVYKTYSYNGNTINDFYNLMLPYAQSYDRISAFFSSNSLIAIAKGLGPFIRNNGKMRLIISPCNLSEEDKLVIINSSIKREEVISRKFVNDLDNEASSDFEKRVKDERLNYLAWLIEQGRLEIKLAIISGSGIFHTKEGIFYDWFGNSIAFNGSANETNAGIKINFEKIQVFCSWVDRENERVDSAKEDFEMLWHNRYPSEIKVFSVPQAVLNKILEYKKETFMIDDPEYTMTPEGAWIDIPKGTKYFCITNHSSIFEEPHKASRLRRSLEPIRFDKEEIRIIYINEDDAIKVLKNIESEFDRIGLRLNYSNAVYNLKSSLDDYEQQFRIHSEFAKKIRNNELEEEVKMGFEEFCKIISETMSNRDPYYLQKLSAFHLAYSRGVCNFSVPGAGKTTIAYAAFSYLKYKNIVEKVIVIGPLSSFKPWENEYKECFGQPYEGRVKRITEISTYKKKEFLIGGIAEDVLLTSYNSIPSIKEDIILMLKKYSGKVMIILDEAHKIKKASGLFANCVLELAKFANVRVVLTGTPLPNGYEDLINLYSFIWPEKDILGYRRNVISNLKKYMNYEIRDNLIDRASPFFVRIKKKDMGVPNPLPDERIRVEMDDIQKSIHNLLIGEIVSTSHRSDPIKLKLLKAKVIRLMQVAANPKLLLNSIKDDLFDLGIDDEIDNNIDVGFDLDEVVNDDIITSSLYNILKDYKYPPKYRIANELIENIISRNEKVIIWTTYINNLKEFKWYLNEQGIACEVLYGGVETTEREKIIEKFHESNSYFKVLIANPAAVAESISLHKVCHNAIYLDRSYNAAHFIQSKDRIHRYGLAPEAKVRYYFLISNSSIDEAIDERLNIKEQNMNEMIESEIPLFENATLGELTDEDIFDILSRYKRE